jgi:hypothetical protein
MDMDKIAHLMTDQVLPVAALVFIRDWIIQENGIGHGNAQGTFADQAIFKLVNGRGREIFQLHSF